MAKNVELKEFAQYLREKHNLETEDNTGKRNIRRKSLADSCEFPEDAEKSSFMLVQKAGEEGADVGACAD